MTCDAPLANSTRKMFPSPWTRGKVKKLCLSGFRTSMEISGLNINYKTEAGMVSPKVWQFDFMNHVCKIPIRALNKIKFKICISFHKLCHVGFVWFKYFTRACTRGLMLTYILCYMAAKTILLKLSSDNLAFIICKSNQIFQNSVQICSCKRSPVHLINLPLTSSDPVGLAREPAGLSVQSPQIKVFQAVSHQSRRGGRPSLSHGECSFTLHSCSADVLLTAISSGLICIRGDSLTHAGAERCNCDTRMNGRIWWARKWHA